jgi:hypothetical protein
MKEVWWRWRSVKEGRETLGVTTEISLRSEGKVEQEEDTKGD